MNKLRAILLAVTAVAALSVVYPAKANTITTFNVSGTCVPQSPFTTTFAGTITIDVTAGTVTAINVSFQGLSAFNTINSQVPFIGDHWLLVAVDSDAYSLSLEFPTGHTPASLVGFTGGTITGVGVQSNANGTRAYTGLRRRER